MSNPDGFESGRVPSFSNPSAARPPLPGGLWLVVSVMAGLLSLSQPLVLPGPEEVAPPAPLWSYPALWVAWPCLALGWWFGAQPPTRARDLAVSGLALAAALAWLTLPPARGQAGAGGGFGLGALALGTLGAMSVQRAAALEGWRSDRWLAAGLFGLWLLWIWEIVTQALQVPRVLLPPPSTVLEVAWAQMSTLARDFVQTVLKAVVVGWALGCGLGFGVALAIDRAPFLQRGLLPLAALTSTVPLVAVAPIAVMWFGFDWPSKAAVVVLMTFFPMLTATLAGLAAVDVLQRELMKTYAASYGQTLRLLRLPAAAPFMLSAMKVNATLALIGAIVAEFFGSPTQGLGFRISTEAARMNMPLVWGAIGVAAVTGSVAYALLVRLERRIAFWHPAVRSAT